MLKVYSRGKCTKILERFHIFCIFYNFFFFFFFFFFLGGGGGGGYGVRICAEAESAKTLQYSTPLSIASLFLNGSYRSLNAWCP